MTPATSLRATWLRHMAARERERVARDALWDAIRSAANDGMSVRQIAAEIGLSHQRVAQILKDEQ